MKIPPQPTNFAELNHLSCANTPRIASQMRATTSAPGFGKGVHVVDFATTKTVSDSLLWIRAIDDALSANVDACITNGLPSPVPGKVYSALTPAGESMKYCATTPTRDAFKYATDNRKTLNHFEVASDAGSASTERAIFNVYDSEWSARNSTLGSLCRNRRGELLEGPTKIVGKDLYGNAIHATLMLCQADIVEFVVDPTTKAVQPRSAAWWVGSYFIGAKSLELPSLSCLDTAECKLDKSLAEATLMVRQDSLSGVNAQTFISRPEDFAKRAQEFYLKNLGDDVAILP